jgi:uncharacterized protein YndB with AHSA1/START domain
MAPLNIIAEPGKHSIIMSREFAAPRERVFGAFTDPKLIPRWWGPKDLTTTVEQMDVRVGGIWRFIQRSTEGSEFPFCGVFHEITAPERLVYTFEFEGTPGRVMLEIITLETITLETIDGRTRMTDTCIYQSVADRDAMIQAGMEEGTLDSWDRIDALLSEMQS